MARTRGGILFLLPQRNSTLEKIITKKIGHAIVQINENHSYEK